MPAGVSARRRRVRRAVLVTLVAVMAAVVGVVADIVIQNDFDVVERRVTFTGNGRTLDGTLAVPETGRGPFGLVIFVHGDGPSDAAAGGFYRPMWEALAAVGYASLSWCKPGVGSSAGNWLDQSMDDRAHEVEGAITWARGRAEVDPRRIGLWGGSQAGWVMPKVAGAVQVAFMIAVSPAINWQAQGRYNLLAELRDRHASAREIENALRRSDRMRGLIERDAGYEQYRAELGRQAELGPDRWGFAKRNASADATGDLRMMRATRVLLVLGGHDLTVDVTDTERVYRATVPASRLQVVRFPDAAHSMIPYDVDRSAVKTMLRGILMPRSLFMDGYLRTLQEFLRG